MKRIIPTVAAALCILSLASCRIETAKDPGPMETRKTEARDFSDISITAPIRVIYIPADTFAVTLRAPQRLHEKINIEVQDSTLVVQQTAEGLFTSSGPYDAELTIRAPRLTAADITGNSSFSCATVMQAPKLKLSVADNGHINIKGIQAEDADLDIAGNGHISVRDIRAELAAFYIAGHGKINARLTGAGMTALRLAGNGRMDLHFDQCRKVNASIAGYGRLKLSGEVESISKEIDGTGHIDTDALKIRPGAAQQQTAQEETEK